MLQNKIQNNRMRSPLYTLGAGIGFVVLDRGAKTLTSDYKKERKKVQPLDISQGSD